MQVPSFDILSPQAGGVSGLLEPFTPQGQVDQARALVAQQQARQATLFKDGLPTDGKGGTDYGAAYDQAMRAGAYDLAGNLISTGIRMRAFNDPSTVDNPTGRGMGAGQGAPAGGGLLSGFLQGSGGGMIAPSAGGDSYGRAPGVGYAGAGQVGVGGVGQAAPAGAAGSASGSANSRGGDPTKGANPQVVDYIKSAFTARGINPNVALGVSGAEGLRGFDPNGSANPGDGGSSFGPFQLHYGGVAGGGNSAPGLGDDFTKATGLDARDPSTWKQQVDFVADHVAQNGWGAFHGAAKIGIGNWLGIGAAPGQPAPQPAVSAQAGAAPGGPVTDSQVMAARQRLAAADGADPRTMTAAQQNALSADTATVSRYGQEQAQPAAPAAGRVRPPGVPDDIWAASGRLYAGQGTPDDVATIRDWHAAGRPEQMDGAGGASTGVPTAPNEEAPRTAVHPYATLTPGVPMATNRPNPALATGGVVAGTPGGSAAPGVRPAAFNGTLPVGPGGAPQAPSFGRMQPQTPPVAPGAAQAASTGPDLPNLPNGYQDPGGGTRYVNDVLTKAAQFKEAGDPRAAIFEARANQVQAQLVAAQAFRNNLALAQARADDRYNTANSPGAIAAAGARAAAEAAERNRLSLVPSVQPDGSTIMIPQSDALASAQAGRPIVSAQPGYVTQGQGNLLAKLNDGSKAYQERQVASQRLDALSSLLETFQTGANSTAFNNAVAQARSFGIEVPSSATRNPAAMQEFTKNGYANVLSSMKEQGNKQYAAEVAAAVNSNPNPDLQPEANAAMIAQMQGTKRWYDQNFRDYSQWYHGNRGAADDADFQTSWTDGHPLGAYVAAAGKDIAPLGVPVPAAGKLVDGQAYQTAGGKMRWSASAGRLVPFSGPTAPILPGQSAGGQGQPRATGAQGQGGQAVPPVAGARQARDGNWYVSDPSRPGKFLMVAN